MSRPTLYFDVDGTINGILDSGLGFDHVRTNDFAFSLNRGNRNKSGDFVNRHKIHLLRNLINNNNVCAVNVSSWLSNDPDGTDPKTIQLSKFLGFHISRSVSAYKRSLAVLDDVVQHNITDFVVIDDDYRTYQDHVGHSWYNDKPYASVLNRCVFTHGRYGLGEAEIEKCSQILGFTYFRYVPALPTKFIREYDFTDPKEFKEW